LISSLIVKVVLAAVALGNVNVALVIVPDEPSVVSLHVPIVVLWHVVESDA